MNSEDYGTSFGEINDFFLSDIIHKLFSWKAFFFNEATHWGSHFQWREDKKVGLLQVWFLERPYLTSFFQLSFFILNTQHNDFFKTTKLQ